MTYRGKTGRHQTYKKRAKHQARAKKIRSRLQQSEGARRDQRDAYQAKEGLPPNSRS